MENFDKALLTSLKELQFSSDFQLKPAQKEMLLNFLSGNDGIGVFPTNFGKSLVYQLAPIVKGYLNDDGIDYSVIVISPINALIDDQLNYCQKVNLYAVKLTAETDLAELSQCKIIYASPELILDDHVRQQLLGISFKILGIVIDEAHLVVKWGQQSRRSSEAFRKAYGELGKLRAFFPQRPFLCLTATANSKTRQTIIKTLGLYNTKILKISPEKPNVRIAVRKVKDEEEFVEFMEPIIEKVRSDGANNKSIVYCSSFKLCGQLYLELKQKLPENHWTVGMYHSQTPEGLKQEILDDFIKTDSFKYSVIVATSALGMGVNIPNIRNIFHFGCPFDVESYVQEIGRAGRDCGLSESFLCYRPTDLANVRDSDLKLFILNCENMCRRKLLMSIFNETADDLPLLHHCCDVCSLKCTCEQCEKKMSCISSDVDENSTCKRVREVSPREREVFKSCLLEGNLVSMKDTEGISSKLEFIDSVDYLVDFGLNSTTSLLVVGIVNEIFNDIPICSNVRKDDTDEIDILSLGVAEQPADNDMLDSFSDDDY